MLSFKEFMYLIENRLDVIKAKNTVDTMDYENPHYFATNDPKERSNRTIEAIHDHDPSPNKMYTQWMVNQYKKKNFYYGDLRRMRETLLTFSKPAVRAGLKSEGKPTDINQYSHPRELEHAVEPHKNRISRKEEKELAKKGGTELVHSGNGVTVHQLKTHEASCVYGAGTKWCTTSKERPDIFKKFSDKGPLYMIQHQGKKYQFHSATKSFMDEKNEPKKLTEIHPDIAKELAKSEHPEIKKANLIFRNPYIEHTHIDDGLNDKDVKVRFAAMRHPNVQLYHIDKGMNDSSRYVRLAAISHPNVQMHHLYRALNDESQYIRKIAKKRLQELQSK